MIIKSFSVVLVDAYYATHVAKLKGVRSVLLPFIESSLIYFTKLIAHHVRKWDQDVLGNNAKNAKWVKWFGTIYLKKNFF